MRYITLIALTLLVVSCSQTPVVDTAQSNDAGMAKVKKSGFDDAYVDPNLKLDSYSAFIFEPLNVAEVEVVDPEVGYGRDSKWEFTEKDAKQLSEAYMKSVHNAFKKSDGFSLAESAGPGVILVKSKLTRFAPTTPKWNSPDRTARSKYLSKTSANFTLETTLIDSQSNKELATIIENRDMGDDINMEEITSVRYALDVKQGFQRWANNFKSRFNKYIAQK